MFSFSSVFVYAEDAVTQIKFFWWRSENVRKELDMSVEQVQRIENIFQSYKADLRHLKEQLDSKESELRTLLQSSSVQRQEVMQLTNDVEHIKANARMIKVDMLLDIREVLTLEQRERLHKIQSDFKRGFPKNSGTKQFDLLSIYAS